VRFLGGRYGTRTHDLCRVKAFQGVALTCDDVRKHLLTCGNTFHSFSLSPGVVRYLAD
jgi:hypothetical protein